MTDVRRTTVVFPKALNKNVSLQAIRDYMSKGELVNLAVIDYLKKKGVKKPLEEPDFSEFCKK